MISSRKSMNTGVLVGCDKNQEWLLPWWLRHFCIDNFDCPIAFADFGMTPKTRSWCKKRGRLLAIHNPLIQNPDERTSAAWKKKYSGETQDLWQMRKTWLKKPVAMSKSPFYRTIWLDLDCQVRFHLQPLFSLALSSAKMAAASVEINQILKPFQSHQKIQKYPHYNTGVVLFEKDSPLLDLWVQSIQEGSQLTFNEEDLLAFIIAYFQIPITPLPHSFNWEVLRFGPNPDALVYHWMGEMGKKAIQKKIEFPFLDQKEKG